MSFDGVLDSVNEEWLEYFEEQKKKGDDSFKSPFWRLAVLARPPAGVDPQDPRVIEALEHIKKVNAT